MKLAFYIGSKGTIWDKSICSITSSKFSHVELVLDNGKCWSSSTYDKGVRAKYLKLSKDKWVLTNCPEVSEQIFLQNNGKKYDYIGLIGTVVRSPIFSSKSKWHCSEIIAEALGLADSWKYTPEDLYRIYK